MEAISLLAMRWSAPDIQPCETAWQLLELLRLFDQLLCSAKGCLLTSFPLQVGDDQDLADLLSSLSPESTLIEGGLYHGALPAAPGPVPASTPALHPVAAAGAAARAEAGEAAAAEGLTNGWEEHGQQHGQAGQALAAGGAAGAAAAAAAAPAQAQQVQQEAAGGGSKVTAVCASLRQALLAAGPSRCKHMTPSFTLHKHTLCRLALMGGGNRSVRISV